MRRYGNSREEKQRWIGVRVGVAAVHQEEGETQDGANKNV